MVGLGRDLGDVVDYVRDNALGTARLLGALHRRPGRAPSPCSLPARW
jgi:hypothetical protein